MDCTTGYCFGCERSFDSDNITVEYDGTVWVKVEEYPWYRTVSVLGDQHVEPNKKVVFHFEDEVSKPSEDQWSWIMGRFMKGE